MARHPFTCLLLWDYKPMISRAQPLGQVDDLEEVGSIRPMVRGCCPHSAGGLDYPHSKESLQAAGMQSTCYVETERHLQKGMGCPGALRGLKLKRREQGSAHNKDYEKTGMMTLWPRKHGQG